mgnify:CR=1 FL=1
MNEWAEKTVPVAAPAGRVWSLLATPQCWPWLFGTGISVDFAGREGGRTRYRLRKDETESEIEVVPAPNDRTVEVRHADRGVLTCRVDAVGHEAVSKWTVSPEAGEPLAAVWRTVESCAPAIEKTSRAIDTALAPDDPLDRAKALVPLARDRADDSRTARTLDPAVVTALRECGIFRIGLPRSLGGADLPARTVVAVVEELSRADSATGWCGFIGNQNAYAAWLPPDTLARMVGPDGSFVLAGSTAVLGTAEPTGDGGYRVNGRWRFNSGCLHADWIMAGVTVPAEDGTRVPRLVFVPWRRATVLDTWHVAGLAGTGSHDVVLADVEVPEDFVAPLFSGPSRAPDPLHRLSPYNIQGVLMVGLPLGLARRALDELDALLSSAAEACPDDLVVEAARLETRLEAARALALSTVDAYWDELRTRPQLTPRSAARLALVLRHAVDTAKHVVESVSAIAEHGGDAGAARTLRVLLRDVYGAGAHFACSDDVYLRNATRFAGRAGDP